MKNHRKMPKSKRKITVSLIIAVFIAAIILHSCNPVYRVLRSESKTKEVVDAYIKRVGIRSDTVLKTLPGDSSIEIIASSDTAYVYDTATSTLRAVITNKIREKITRTITITKTINNRDFAVNLQRENIEQAFYIKQLKAHKKRWMIAFFSLSGFLLLILLIKKAFKK